MNTCQRVCLLFVVSLFFVYNLHALQFDNGIKKVTAHFCPFMCTIGDAMLCNPPPCPPPQCVDPAKMRPTDCCEYCLNGSNCGSPDGVPIKYNHSRIISGKNCTCLYPPFEADCVGVY